MTSSSEVIAQQQPPQSGQGDIWMLVIQDMAERRQMGLAKYGKPVQAWNGRKPLIDAYQELLDLLVYMRQELQERAALERETRKK